MSWRMRSTVSMTSQAPPGSGSQDSEPAFAAFDDGAANDFFVCEGAVWSVDTVEVAGGYYNGPGPADSINVTIYAEDNGLPGFPFFDVIETAAHNVVSGYTCGGPGSPGDPQQRRYFRQAANATRGHIAKIVYLSVTAGAGCARRP